MKKVITFDAQTTPGLRELHSVFIEEEEIVVAYSAWSGLRIGLRRDYKSQHMSLFSGRTDCWANFSTGWKHYNMHFKQDPETKSVWCNFGQDLAQDNTDFPYLFMNGIQWVAFHNLAEKKRKELRDVYKQCPNA